MKDVIFIKSIIDWCDNEIASVDTLWSEEDWTTDGGWIDDIAALQDAARKLLRRYAKES